MVRAICLSICLIFLLPCIAKVDSSFEAVCKFETHQSGVFEKNCNVALFSKSKSFRINGTLVYVDSLLCDLSSAMPVFNTPAIALIRRGGCTFDK